MCQVGVEHELLPVAVGAGVGVGVGHVDHVAEPVAHDALRHSDAPVRADAPQHLRDLARVVLIDREAAHHDHAAAVHDLVLEAGEIVRDEPEREVAPLDVLDSEVETANVGHGVADGRVMPRAEVERDVVLALEVARLPGSATRDPLPVHDRPSHGPALARPCGPHSTELYRSVHYAAGAAVESS